MQIKNRDTETRRISWSGTRGVSRVFLLRMFMAFFVSFGEMSLMGQVGEEDPVYSDKDSYLQAREQLVQQDQEDRFDADIVLSPLETEVNHKLQALQRQMRSYYDSIHYFPPSLPFQSVKSHIERTPLYHLFRRMPKGGLLHLHPAAALDFAWMLDTAMSLPECYVYWQEPNGTYVKGQIRFFPEDNYPEGFLPIQHLAREIPDFKEQMLDLLTLSAKESHPSFSVWREFEKIFQRFYGFVQYQPMYKAAFRNIIDSLLADGVQHIELRVIPRELYDLEHKAGSGYYTPDTMLQYLQELEREVQEDFPAYTHKVIVTDLRFESRSNIFDALVKAYGYRKQYPKLIKGFDLVANEDDGNTTQYFLDNWMKMDSLEKVYGIDLPLYLHDGESDWASVDNLYDAVLLNSRRIGHGFNLNHFPILIEEIKERDICLEVSPLSNQVLGYVQDLRVHPANFLLKKGVQISINSDDPAIFGYSGLSYDFWSIFLAWELDVRALKKLTKNSLIYSSLSEEEKQDALAHWEEEWGQFIKYANSFLE